MINRELALERNLDNETIKRIEERQAFRKMLGELYTSGKLGARIYREEWTTNEYRLQDLWGFQRNSAYHRFWEMEGCSCPKMDNEDGYPFRFVKNSGCPIHGNDMDLTSD